MPPFKLWLTSPAPLLFVIVFSLALLTMPPTFFTLDGPEFATAAKTLGIPHPPGYPLYTLLAHGMTYLPIGDVAYRVNLFSVLALSATAPLLYHVLQSFLANQLLSASTTLMFIWSYRIWTMGIVAEVYIPQVFLLTLCAWVLVQMGHQQKTSWRWCLAAGASFGLAVAMNSSSALFAPGLVLIFLSLPITWPKRLAAGAASLVVFALPLLYLPLRSQADLELSFARTLNAQGGYDPIDLTTLDGLWWMISARLYDGLFFAKGYLPSLEHWADFGGVFGGNFLFLGVLVGIVGLGVLWRQNRRLCGLWLVLFLPYTYFYLTYGAIDSDTMFAPSFLVFTLVLGYGLQWALEDFRPQRQQLALIAIPLLFLAINFPLVNVSDDSAHYDNAEQMLAELPPDTYFFGYPWTIAPVEYLQIVEGRRRDVSSYNITLFLKRIDSDLTQLELANMYTYLDDLLQQEKMVIFSGDAAYDLLPDAKYKKEVLTVIEGEQQVNAANQMIWVTLR